MRILSLRILLVVGALQFAITKYIYSQSVLFEAPLNLPVPPPDPPTVVAGHMLMWYAEQAALRFGSVNNLNSNGIRSTSWGRNNAAFGLESTSWGSLNMASGPQSTAFGTSNSANGSLSTSWGSSTNASGVRSTTWGTGTSASGGESTAWGEGTSAVGSKSTAWGSQTIANSSLETVFGRFNETSTPLDPVTFSSTDFLFAIGNGTSNSDRKNALSVYKSGNTRIGGALSVDANENAIIITAANHNVDPKNKSFLRIGSDSADAANRQVNLFPGSNPGQILMLTCACDAAQWSIVNQEVMNPLGTPVNLGANTRVVAKGDVLVLLWDGTSWLEVSYSNN